MDLLEFHKIRKSLLMSWKVCARQAYYSVRDKDYGQYNEFNLSNPALLLGQIFHKEMDKFYSGIDVDKMIEIASTKIGDDSETLRLLEEHCFAAFSPTTNEKCLNYFHWYSKVEAERFMELYLESHTGITQRFIPLYIEKFVEILDEKNGIYRNGHFDRVDFIAPGKLRLVEYKTGASYDVTKSYKLTKLRLELYYYKKIIEQLDEFKDYEVVEWMLINPTTMAVFKSKFSVLTERVLEKSIPELAADINGKEPPKRTLNFYCYNCKFKKECLIDVKENIFDIPV